MASAYRLILCKRVRGQDGAQGKDSASYTVSRYRPPSVLLCSPHAHRDSDTLAACLPGLRDWSLPEVSSRPGETQLVAPVGIRLLWGGPGGAGILAAYLKGSEVGSVQWEPLVRVRITKNTQSGILHPWVEPAQETRKAHSDIVTASPGETTP